MAVSTVADFVEALQRWPLLDDAQFVELSANLRHHFTEPRALAKELLNRGWLTPYQVNHLAQGKASELILGGYVLLERLGEGGMGAVFKARHRRLDRIVAIKLIRKERLKDDEAVRRFRREIRAAAQLSHPHIVLAFDADEADGVHFFVMEYVEGNDLGKLVQQHGPLPVAQACEYIRQAAEALQHAYKKGMVHRDIKPSNLLVASGTRGSASDLSLTNNEVNPRPTLPNLQLGGPPPTGSIKLLDLGLARLNQPTIGEGSDSSLTEIGTVVGTPDFMAPEQAEDSRQVDTRGDLYSLGCTFYFLLSGQPPFTNLTPMEKLFHHRYHEARPIEERRPEVSPTVAGILRKLMAKKPDDRFQTPDDLVAALEAVAAGGTETTIQSTPPPPPPVDSSAPFRDIVPSDTHDSEASPRKEKRSAERRRWFWVNVAAAVVLLGALGLFVTLLGQRGSTTPDEGSKEDQIHKAAIAEMRGLKARAADASADRDALRLDLLTFRRTYPGTPQALEAAGILRWLPSPLDTLKPVDVAPEDWEGRVPELVAILGDPRQRHWGPAACVAVTSDGKTIASGGDDHVIRLWDPITFRERAVLRGHAAGVSSVAVSSDGKRLLSTGAAPDRTVRLWDTGSGKELSRLGDVSGAAFAADGKHVLVGGKGWFGLWEPESSQVVRRFDKLPSFVTQLAAAADGKHVLLAMADDKVAHLWDVEAGKEVQKLEGHQGEVHFVAFSADGKHALTGSVTAGRLWDAATGKELHRLPHKGANHGVFAPDGKHVLTGGADKMLRFWDANTGKEVRHLEGHDAPVRGVAVAGDGKHAFSAGADTTVRRWDLDTGKEVEPISGPVGGLTNVVFGPEGRLLFGGLRTRRLFVWEITGETKYRPFAEEALGVLQFALAPDGRLALSAGDLKSIPVWDTTTAQRNGALGNQEGVRIVTISPDGQAALAGGPAGGLRLWDVVSGKELHRFEMGTKAPVTAVAFAPDGKQAAAAAEQTIRLWEVPGGKDVRLFTGLPGAVRAMAFSPDGRRLFAVGGDALVHRWMLGTNAPASPLEGKHKEDVAFVVVSPDAQSVASGTESGEVIVWELSTGKRQYRWQLPGPISGLAFASDSRHLATANGNGSVYILRLAAPEPK